MEKLFLAFSDKTVDLAAPGSNALTMVGAYDALDFAGDSVTGVGEDAPPFPVVFADGDGWTSDLGDGTRYGYLVVLAPSPTDRLALDGRSLDVAILHVPAGERLTGRLAAA